MREKENCSECYYYLENKGKRKKKTGRCRRYPPKGIVYKRKMVSVGIGVYGIGWCGEYKAK